MSSFHVAIIFRYLWGECLNLWHFYCGFLSPICTIYKENGNIYDVRNGTIPALCGVPSLLQPLPPFPGNGLQVWFNMSLLRGRTHSRLTIALILDCHCILDYLFYKFVQKHCRTRQRNQCLRLSSHVGGLQCSEAGPTVWVVWISQQGLCKEDRWWKRLMLNYSPGSVWGLGLDNRFKSTICNSPSQKNLRHSFSTRLPNFFID